MKKAKTEVSTTGSSAPARKRPKRIDLRPVRLARWAALMNHITTLREMIDAAAEDDVIGDDTCRTLQNDLWGMSDELARDLTHKLIN